MQTLEYASYVIELTTAMLEHKRRLNTMHIDQIDTIRRRAVQFVTDMMLHENRPLDELVSYLNHDAMSPITIVIGFSELLLMEATMPQAFLEAMEEIRDCGYLIRDDIYDLRAQLLEFMENIGLKHRSRHDESDLELLSTQSSAS